MTNPQLVFNGKITSAARISLSDMDRAFRFGDSWFETMLLRGKNIRFWADHQQRIAEAAAVSGFDVPDLNSVPELASRLSDMLADADAYRVRLTLWIAEGRGYTPLSGKMHWLLEVTETGMPSGEPQRLGICTRAVVFSGRGFSGKTGNSAPYVQASAEALQKGWQHILLLNEQGMITETANANIFWKKENTYYTPALSSGCIAGVMRRNVIRAFQNEGITCEEVLLPPSVLPDASEIFVSNALIGIKNIHLFDQKQYPAHAEKIFSSFFQA